MIKQMPVCPGCECTTEVVELAVALEIGSHICYGLDCGFYFTPTLTAPDASQFKTLSPRFLALMDEIGLYGLEKYGDRSVEARFSKGDFSRDERTKSREVAKHAANHFEEYLDGVKHDNFGTREHQLAAAAFNAMLEYQFFIEGR